MRDAFPEAVDHPLLIGIGQPDSGDDAAGRLVARGLRGLRGLDVAECDGNAADLLALMAGRGRVVIVDACLSGAPVGTILRPGAEAALPGAATSTHGLGLAEALALGRALGILPGEVRLVLIEGAGFGLGQPVSAPVTAAIQACIAALSVEFGGGQAP